MERAKRAGGQGGAPCESVRVRSRAARRVTIAVPAAAVAAGLVLVIRALAGGAPAHVNSAAFGVAANDGTASVASPPAVPRLLPARRPTGAPVTVSVATGVAGPRSPGDFLGLSFETRSLPAIAADAQSGDLVALLRSLGPGVLRFGGVSADEEAAWTGGGPLPGWARVALTPGDLAGLATLAHATGWRVLLTVNLGHYDPAAAAAEAAAARAALGPYLAGVAIGNEPDRYVRKGQRAAGWDFAAYRRQAAAYAAAIERAAPGVTLAGPDPASGVPGLAWLAAAAHTLHLGLLTDHYYPLSSCGYAPTIEELLSASVRAHESETLARTLAIARVARRAVRIDEANSVSCEGRAGVSNTFAEALWAVDYTARAMAAGVAGVNFHDLPAKPDAYSPLVFATHPAAASSSPHSRPPYSASTSTSSAANLRPAPEWYALLAARELSGSQPVHTQTAGATPSGLSAQAFRARDGRLRIVLVDYEPPGSSPLAVHLQISGSEGRHIGTSRERGRTGMSLGVEAAAPRYRTGSVLRLTAPSLASTSGVRLGGRMVAPDGSWRSPSALPAVYGRALAVQLDPSSAAVVTLYPSR